MKARLDEVVDATVGDALREVVHDRALVSDVMTAGDVERIREEMERAEARKLQPHFIRSFFLTAFALPRRSRSGNASRAGSRSATSPPSCVAVTARSARGAPLLRRYERVTFEKDLVAAEARTGWPSTSRQAIPCSTGRST